MLCNLLVSNVELRGIGLRDGGILVRRHVLDHVCQRFLFGRSHLTRVSSSCVSNHDDSGLGCSSPILD